MVREIPVEFKWHAGMSVSQKQKSVFELHEAACARLGIGRVLEVSTKSKEEIGRALSAFNLQTRTPDGHLTPVEVVYQASKTFELGGPYLDLLAGDSYAAKTDERLKNSGALVSFSHRGEIWPLEPSTAFYDWLYICALAENESLALAVVEWEAFTDIEFNPEKSLNCQARSIALYCSMMNSGSLAASISSPKAFRALLSGKVYEASQSTFL